MSPFPTTLTHCKINGVDLVSILSYGTGGSGRREEGGEGGEPTEFTFMEVDSEAVETSEAEGTNRKVIILRAACLQNLNPIDT